MISKRWEMRKEELIKIYEAHGKKNKTLLKKISLIPNAVRDDLMTQYYLKAKKIYLDALTEWFHKREGITKVFANIAMRRKRRRRLR